MHLVIPIDSSFVEQIGYDTYTHTCVVTINGSDYIYLDITFDQFKQFIKADSKGSFYNLHVRGRW